MIINNMTNLVNKNTIVALKHLEHDFFKLMKHTTDYTYNDVIVNNDRMLLHNNNIKAEIKSHIQSTKLDLHTDINKIHSFINDNLLEKETYKIKIPIRMITWLLDKCIIQVLEDSNGILCLCAYKIEKIQLNDKIDNQINIKMLCTDNRYRNKKYAKYLLKLIQRNQINEDCTHGYFMSNINIRVGLAKLTYYYRPINPDILLQAGFSGFKESDFKNSNKSIQDYYKIDTSYSLNIKPLNIDYVQYLDKVFELYEDTRQKYNFSIVYSKDEFKEMLFNENVKTYLVWNDDEIVDFVSYYVFYHESIINKQRRDISVANLFMYTTNHTTPYKLIKNLLTILAENNIDMITMLDNMENDILVETMNFINSQTHNYVYLFNWHHLPIKPLQIGPIFYF